MTAPPLTPPTPEGLRDIAEAELKALPDALAGHVTDVVIRIADFPDPETERDMELRSPFDLLGLYVGVPVGEKSVTHAPQDVDMIFLYRRPILDYWSETGDALDHIVRHVLIHEIGHHFGFSDADMERIEREG